MAGFTTCRKVPSKTGSANGVRIYKDGKEIFLDQDECNKLAQTIWHAQREYWKEAAEK